MTTISKTTITFTVLHRTDAAPFQDIDGALWEAREGHAVGMETDFETVEVPDEKVEGELVALGNDGEFFNDDLAELEFRECDDDCLEHESSCDGYCTHDETTHQNGCRLHPYIGL